MAGKFMNDNRTIRPTWVYAVTIAAMIVILAMTLGCTTTTGNMSDMTGAQLSQQLAGRIAP